MSVSLNLNAGDKTWSVSTNLLTWANMGTINAEGGLGIHQKISLIAGFAVNPWQTSSPTRVQLQNKQYGGYVGAKFWPWHTYSGTWIGMKAQYKNFEHVGIFTSNYTEGEAVGAGLSAGYAFMITPNLNIDAGLGVWGGRLLKYNKYQGKTKHPSLIKDTGARNFFSIDNIIISISYIF